jgi:hypothetical protein
LIRERNVSYFKRALATRNLSVAEVTGALRRTLQPKSLVQSSALLGFLLAMISWPYKVALLAPGTGLDASWKATLALAARHQLEFGNQIIFTYGPLGFVTTPSLYYTSTAVLAFGYALLLNTIVFATLLGSLRRVSSLAVSLVVAFIAGSIVIDFGGPELSLALALALCLSILRRQDCEKPLMWQWGVLGVGLALFGLIKVSLGIGIGLIIAVTLVCASAARVRSLVAVLVGAVPTFLIGWVGTGNGLGNLGTFLRTSISVTTGYASAMSLEAPGRWYGYWLALVVSATVAVFAVTSSRGLQQRARVGVVVCTVIALWVLFREGFVRHDAHELVLFAAIPLLVAAFRSPRVTASWLIVAMLGSVVIACSEASGVPPLLTQPVLALRNLGHEAVLLASPGRRARFIDQSRHAMVKSYALPPSMVARMQGTTVDIDPWEQSVAWAYPGIRFDPLPVVQDYLAYTGSLDRIDTEFLRSTHAPRLILRQGPEYVDHRVVGFDPPATQVAMECRYRQIEAQGPWQLLERVPDRCGTLRPLGTVSTGLGHWVSVPRAGPNEAIVARFQVPLSFWWRLQDEAFKPPSAYVSINNEPRRFRFILGTADSSHMLDPAAILGYGPAFTPTPIESLAVWMSGQGRSSTGVRMAFYAVPMTG